MLLFASLRWDDSSRARRFDLSISLAVVATVILSYHVLAHDLCLLLLPLLLLANDFFEHGFPITDRRIAMLTPMLVLFLSPLLMLLWFRYGEFSLLAPVLLLWFYGISRELLNEKGRANLKPA